MSSINIYYSFFSTRSDRPNRKLPLLSYIALIFVLLSAIHCRKSLTIPLPQNTLIAPQVFSTDAEAISAASGMYFNMINQGGSYSAVGMTLYGGLSADELIPFNQSPTEGLVQFYKNQLLATGGPSPAYIWDPAFSTIYAANSIIDGLSNYSGVSSPVKNELTGEAEFVRAFCDFYLVNVYGDIPLVTTINYHTTSSLPRTPKDQVYQAIIADLLDAQNRLAVDYSAGNGQRIVPNKWAATAMLARVYLYTGSWAKAEAQATAVINNSSLYSLIYNLDNIFLINSSEAIWQLQQSNRTAWHYATPEGFLFIPDNNTSPPYIYLTPEILNTFEPGDQRKLSWIDSIQYAGTMYYYPYKYKIGANQANMSAFSEYYMVLRLAEQYLIRAEARAEQGESNAITDIDTIRVRAGLQIYSGPTDMQSVLNAIIHERQVEFFSEWGHRWLDLKRWGNATTILTTNKGFTVGINALLYPIPFTELGIDPNLTQNPGY